MSKFLKFIVNIFLICAILIAAAILIPPLAGIQTTIVDTASMDTNLPLGSITYSTDVDSSEIKAGDEVLKDNNTSTYAYIVKKVNHSTDTFTVVNAMDQSAGTEEITLRNSVPKVAVVVPYIGYVIIAMHSTEGIIIIALVVVLIVILFILSELWKEKPEEEEDEDEESGKTYSFIEESDEERNPVSGKITPDGEEEEVTENPDQAEDEDVLTEENPEEENPEREESTEEKQNPAEEPEERPAEEQSSEYEMEEITAEEGSEEEPEEEPAEEQAAAGEQSSEEEPKEKPAEEESPEGKQGTAKDRGIEMSQDAKEENGFLSLSAPDDETAGKEDDLSDISIPSLKRRDDTADETPEIRVGQNPDSIDLSDAIEQATKEAEKEAEEQAKSTGSGNAAGNKKPELSINNIEDSQTENSGEDQETSAEPEEEAEPEQFVPVEHATLDELLDQAKKNGDEPDVSKDEATGITIVDYSGVL